MIETKISIDSINSVDFYGVNNTKLQLIKNFFPKMTISARGNKIIAKAHSKGIVFVGNYDKLNITKNQTKLIEQFTKNNSLSEMTSTITNETCTIIALKVKTLQNKKFKEIITPKPLIKIIRVQSSHLVI